MPSPIVTVATFATDAEAQLARSLLESGGIGATVMNESGTAVAGGPDAASGRVLLQVPRSQARQALGFLEGEIEESHDAWGPTPEQDVPRCPICRSSNLEATDYGLPVRVLRTLLLTVLPLPREWFERRTVRCGVCHHQSRPDAPGQAGGPGE